MSTSPSVLSLSRAAALVGRFGHGGVGCRARGLGERAEIHLEAIGPETRIAGGRTQAPDIVDLAGGHIV